MVLGLEPSLYIGRGCCALAVLIAILIPAPVLSYICIERTVSYRRLTVLQSLLALLFLLYLGDFATLVAEAAARGEPPDSIASFSETAFVLAIALHLDQISGQGEHPAWYVDFTCWLLLCSVELFTLIRLGPRQLLCSVELFTLVPPGLRQQPAAPWTLFKLGILFTALKALAWIAILVYSYRAMCEKYWTQPQSAPQDNKKAEFSNDCKASDPQACDDSDSEDDKKAEFSNDCKASDPQACDDSDSEDDGIVTGAHEEVKQFDGWWLSIKKYSIFFEYMWPFGQPLLQLWSVVSFVCVVAGCVIRVLEPVQLAILLDAVRSGTDPWRPLMILILLDAADSDLFLNSIDSLLRLDIGLYRSKKLQVAAHSKIMSMDAYFHSVVHPTDLIKAVDYAENVDDLLEDLAFRFVPKLVTLTTTVSRLLDRYGPFMILIVTHMAAFYCIVEKNSVAKLAMQNEEYFEAKHRQERLRQDGVRGWSTVSNHNRVKHEIDLFDSAVGSYMRQRRRYGFASYAFDFSRSVVLYSGLVAGYVFVIHMYRSGDATIGDLVAFHGLWALLLSPVKYMTSVISNLLKKFLYAERLRRIMERPTPSERGDRVLEYDTGTVEFRNVSFSYPGSKGRSIDDISLTIKGGSTVAFVGPSGVGKSTLLKLLMRVLPAEAGAILVDGQDIQTLETDSLHDNIGMMPQSSYVFDSTVMENLRYANEDATDEQVYEACRGAGIHDTIMARTGKYQARTGENGQKFSGGERQRLVLARTFLQDPKIVLIDEGTSELDAENETAIRLSVAKRFAKQTVIIVAHRLSTIRHVDRILVLGKGGKILEDGSHDELVAKNGEYATYWRMHIGEQVEVEC